MLTSASTNGAQVTIVGTLNSLPNSSFALEFFANASCDPSGFGEGEFFVGSANVITNEAGNAAFQLAFPAAVAAGEFVTATATHSPSGSTSEISACFAAIAGSAAIVAANPPVASPYVPGPFRDVLQTGTGPTLTQGIGAAGTPDEDAISFGQISVTFSGTPSPAPNFANLAIMCTDSIGNGLGDCPMVADVVGSGSGPYVITLNSAIPPRECTTITFSGTTAGQKLQYQSLPGDVNLDGTANTQDLLALVQALNNGSANEPATWAHYNLNRSTQIANRVNTQDLLRAVQLLNGVNAPLSFAGAVVEPCP